MKIISNKIYFLSLSLIFWTTFSNVVLAETVYIDDKILIWTRTGPSNAYKVRYRLEPGAKLEVVQRDAETGFVEVKDEQGRNSWVDPKLLTSQPTAHQKLKEANAEIVRLKSSYEEKVRVLQAEINQMTPLKSVNSNLQQELAKAQTEAEQSRQKAQLYESGFDRDTFFAGAAVMLGGMFLGWLFSKFGGKRKNTGWN
ncbi:TIGR04211 family SH3 domain-containing protein [Aliikangiella sp. G2MR2-5]|uniref:TIGR04211 family SH3 domain-containing protein n=1 Tax=Aliikangiella sp. G2MR2-5 TaxID=2788943 RepID=UPI0018A8B860|nr:TIGR04211 family SH3 domain-containing protein [Aliikangiella sp. G2MR2-5]